VCWWWFDFRGLIPYNFNTSKFFENKEAKHKTKGGNMPRVERIRISKKRPVENFLRNYGVGGAENYDWEQINAILQAIALILDNTGYLELEQVGKFLLKLSDNVDAYDRAIEELEEWGYMP
jgi:hypothetical protein